MMPAHHIVKAFVVTILACVFLIFSALFWQGTHDSPYPPTEQRENQ